MAGASLLTLIDDIATLLDDISLMTKMATKKTAGVLGDDLALNAQQVTGVKPARELPVVWAVAKGSLINKAILVPVAVAISYFAPWLVTPLLMLGGAFLCFEGAEKVIHKFFHKEKEKVRHAERREAMQQPDIDLKALEKKKISGAIRTDFILSAEIIAITLGVVTGQSVAVQFAVLAIVAVMITVCVYGLVAGIVKLDDGGLYLAEQESEIAQKVGRGILWVAPYMMKTLSILGTIAMFLVGGGILVHGIAPLHEAIHRVAVEFGGIVASLVPMLINGLIGLAAGLVLVAIIMPLQRWWEARSAA